MCDGWCFVNDKQCCKYVEEGEGAYISTTTTHGKWGLNDDGVVLQVLLILFVFVCHAVLLFCWHSTLFARARAFLDQKNL